MPTCNCPVTKTLNVYYQVTDPPATANHVFSWKVVGDTAYTTISPNPTPTLLSAPNNYFVQLPNIPVCEDVEVTIQRQCANNQNSPVQTSIAQAGLSYGCTDSISGSRTGSTFYVYPTVLLDLSNAPETVKFNYSTLDPNNPTSPNPPNRFLIKNSDGVDVFSSGWKGQADYTGEWGASLNTLTTGSFTFNRGTGCFYTLIVDTIPNGTQSDFWSLSIDCTNTGDPPVDPTIDFVSCSAGIGRYTINGTSGTNLKLSISSSGQLTNTNSPNNCAAIDVSLTSSTGPTTSGVSSLIPATGTATVGSTNEVFLTLTIPASGYITIDTGVIFKNSAIAAGSVATLKIFEVNGATKNITRDLCIGTTTTSVPCVTDPPPCECPAGYTLTPDNSQCVLEETIAATAPTQSAANRTLVARGFVSYSSSGTVVYTGGYNASTGVATGSTVSLSSEFWTNPNYISNVGPLNRTAVWTSLANIPGQRVSFSTCININETKTYLVGVGCDNRVDIKLNGVTVVVQSPSALTTYFRSLGATLGDDTAPFVYWHIYPVTINAGNNILEIGGINDGDVAGVGVEIYDATVAELELVGSYTDLGPKLLFSTKDLRGTVATGGDNGFGYSCPTGYVLKTCGLTTPICYKVTSVSCTADVVPPTITVLTCSAGVGSYRITAAAGTVMKVSLSAAGSLTNNDSNPGYCAQISGKITSNTGPSSSAVSNTIETGGTATVGASNALFITVTIPSSGSIVITTEVLTINSYSAMTNATLRIFEVNSAAVDYTQSVCVSSKSDAVVCSGGTFQNYLATKYSCSACEVASIQDGVIVALPSGVTAYLQDYYIPSSASGQLGSFVYKLGSVSLDGPGLILQNIHSTTCSGACLLSTTLNSDPEPMVAPEISSINRLATIQDVGVIPNASVGDLIIFGPNDGTGLFIKNTNSDIETLAPGAKILIRGGVVYDFIEINSNLSGTLANPIVITNFCGQVESKTFGVVGMRHFKVTGKYDPGNKTGDINYQGHATGYAWSQGKYGIYVNNRWTNTDAKLIYIQSGIPVGTTAVSRTDNYELEYVESGNGGYSNLFKWDYNDPEASNAGYPTAVILNNIRIHDNYFHDLAGEGMYMGYFDAGKTGYEIFENLKVYNNRAIRCGRESFQIKRFGTGTEIYNNVGINTGMDCFDSQNFATVLWNVNGGTSVNNNLFVGNSGYAAVQWYVVNSPSYTPSATTASFVSNAMLHMGVDETLYAGARGMFIKSEDQIAPILTAPYTLNVPPIAQNISNNYFGFFDSTYPESVVDNNNYLVDESSPISATNNTYTGKNTFWAGSGPTVNTNNVNGTVNDVSFVNLNYGTGFDWSRFRFWQNAGGNNNYTPGWYVMHKSRIYKAIANSTGIEPGVTAGWQTSWELQTYNGGASYLPADDVRVSTGNFYNTNNIGLLDNP